MSGEPTQTSVILVARLHKSDTLIDNDLQGIEGFIKFRITRDIHSKNYMESPFFHALQNNDFGAKYEFTGLRPGQKYFYSISYGRDTANTTSSSWSNFKTLNLTVSDKNISFAITNRLNYQTFQTVNSTDFSQTFSGISYHSVFPVFNAISSCQPDFWIVNGETESSNISEESLANSQKITNAKWHNLFSIPEFNRMLLTIPSYWILSETAISKNDGIAQIPVYPPNPEQPSFYRTYRLNRDVQVWMLSDLFSAKTASNTTRYDVTELNWLKNSLKESDSPFKLIISSEALIGSGDINEIENKEGYGVRRMDKDSIFHWLKNNGFLNNGLYFICNSHDSRFHSIDPTGFEEFSCGTLVNAQKISKMVKPDSISGISEKVVQPYFQKNSTNGFLMIYSGRNEYNSPVLVFRFFDEAGKLLYSVNKY